MEGNRACSLCFCFAVVVVVGVVSTAAVVVVVVVKRLPRQSQSAKSEILR